MNNNNDLIPFNLQKWMSGEYNAVCEDLPTKIYEIDKGRIYTRIENDSIVFDLKGIQIHPYDINRLMLRKKKVVKWQPVFGDQLCDSEEEVIDRFSHRTDFKKAIQVEI